MTDQQYEKLAADATTAGVAMTFMIDAEMSLKVGALTLDQFAVLQRLWSTEAFGSSPPRGPTGPLKHLAKEVPEALEAVAEVERVRTEHFRPRAYQEDIRQKLLMELVDCYFLVCDAVWRAGFGPTELRQALGRKLQVNRQRKWPPMAPDQAVEHDRTGEQL